MLHRSSIGLSGADGGHIMAHKESMVFFLSPSAWNVVLSCLKIIYFRRHNSTFYTMAENSWLGTPHITHSGNLKGSTISLLKSLVQIITPPPPCCCCSLVGTWWPFNNHPDLHPPGPSSVAQHSLVNRIVRKLVFMYF